MVTIRLKEGVELATARPEILEAIQACAQECADYARVLTVTSIMDGEHGPKSLHRFGLAFDARTHTWTRDTIEYLSEQFSIALGHDYDVVLEDDHIHVEYDP